jgi:hypothetical protein
MPIVSVVLAVEGHDRVTEDDENELKRLFAGQILSNIMTTEEIKKRLRIEVDTSELSISVRIENTIFCIFKGWEMLILGRDHKSCLRTTSIAYSKIRESFPYVAIIGLDVRDEKRSRLRRFMEKVLIPLVVAIEGLIGSLTSIYASYLPIQLVIGLPVGIGISISLLLVWFYLRST